MSDFSLFGNKDAALLKEQLERERKLRQAAEQLLEGKSLEAFQLKQAVEQKAAELTDRNMELIAINDQLQDAYSRIQQQERSLAEFNRNLLESIRYGERIQQAVLPRRDELRQYFPNSLVLFQPKSIVSGDFYWGMGLGDSALFAVGDCTGHGVPGAFLSLLGLSFLNRLSRDGVLGPAAILTALDQEIRLTLGQTATGGMQDGIDIALGRYWPATGRLLFSGAMRNLTVVENGQIRSFKGDRQPVGGMQTEKLPFSEQEILLGQGAAVYLYSDGYYDQFGGTNNRKMGSRAFERQLLASSYFDLQQQKAALIEFFNDWRGPNEQTDDVTIVGFRHG